MNETQDPFLAEAFFDAPGLLSVRFARRGNHRLANFATYRRPDVTPAPNAFGIAKLVGVSVLFGCVGFTALRGCTSVTSSGRDFSRPVIDGAVSVDSAQAASWTTGLDQLADDLAPTRADLRPWMARTLLDVPRDLAQRGNVTGNWLQPRHADRDAIANRQGKLLLDMLVTAGAARDLAVILDLPGPAAVAAAASMARRFEPVFTMNNLPHPAGVVPSAQTLAAAVYWRAEFISARTARPADAPAVFVLEGDRLARYDNEVDRFDNRSTARLPDVSQFKALGINRILYVRQHRGGVTESDDLNVLFTELATAGIEVKHLALDSLDPPPAQTTTASNAPRPAIVPTHHWFWNNYGWYRPVGSPWNGPSDPDAGYRSTSRSTLFSRGSTSAAFDGGNSQRTTAFTHLTPAPRPTGSSGGSWVRSSSHSSG